MIKYREIDKYKYQLLEPYSIKVGIYKGVTRETEFLTLDIDGTLTIKKYYAWDGPSGPTFDTKSFMRGSLVHDALYQLIRSKKIGLTFRKKADKLLRDICLEDGMSSFRAWYVYNGVRVFGGLCI